MKRFVTTILIAATAATTALPLAAQERPDLAYSGSASAIAERGTAVMASVRIPLGSPRERRSAEQRVRFDLVAGPSIRLLDGSQLRQANVINGDGIRLSFAPGHSTRLSLNGRSLVTRYANARVAAAEGAESGGGPTTLGWMAIAGGAVLVGLGVTYLAFEDAIDCTENGEYVCE